MTYVITEACVGHKDSACYGVCPVDAIHPTADEPGFAEAAQLFIDPAECIDCEACLHECPVNAIFSDEMLPDGLRHNLELNAAHYG